MSGPYEMSDSRLVDALRDLTATLKAENDFAEQEAASKADARRIIAEFMFDAQLEWDELTDSPWSGELAAKLYATWRPVNVMEPVCESDYAEKLPADIRAALTAMGRESYEKRCQEVGRRVVEAAMRYLFDCHGMIDVDIAREDAARMDAEYRRALASRRG